jgi:membrane protein
MAETQGAVAGVLDRVARVREWGEQTLLWQVWTRMLEIEFVDRSVALAGKAFVSFFPLVIVVAAFVPESIRASIFETLTHRLGLDGAALSTTKQAFASAEDIRRATGLTGLVMTIFFASSFTTALQRVYLRAWRRPPRRASTYTRGPVWLVVMLMVMAAMGGLRGVLGDGLGLGLFLALSLAITTSLWWFTAWYLLRGEVRLRVLLPTGIVTSLLMAGYAVSANVWMPSLVERNDAQFGFFGVALALVSWFSGASICVLIGACAGPVFAEDEGLVGSVIRGGDPTLLAPGSAASLPGPDRDLRLRDAFSGEDEL